MIHPLTTELYADAQATLDVIADEFPDAIVVLVVDGEAAFNCEREEALGVLRAAIERMEGK